MNFKKNAKNKTVNQPNDYKDYKNLFEKSFNLDKDVLIKAPNKDITDNFNQTNNRLSQAKPSSNNNFKNNKSTKKQKSSVIDLHTSIPTGKKKPQKKSFLANARLKVTSHAQKTLSYGLKFRTLSHISPWKKNTTNTNKLANANHDSSWQKISDSGSSFTEVLNIIDKHITPNLIPTQNPYFMGHMTTHIPSAVHEADILISYFNQNLVKKETCGGSIEIERFILNFFHKLIYNRTDSYYLSIQNNNNKNIGQMVSGGTMANLNALTVALNNCLNNYRQLGLCQALAVNGYKKAVVITSKRAHYSIAKACSMLGLGEDNLISIPVDPYTHKMKIDHLINYLKSIYEDKNNKILVVAVVALAGSTETGSIDDLNQISNICQSYNIWLHIDAAWAGAYFISDKLKTYLKGAELADSISIDGHKLVGLTMGGGMIFFKDCNASAVICQSSQYILREGSKDSGKYHLEGSRPFYALKLWMLCKRQGKAQLAHLVEQSHQRAEIFQKIIELTGHFVQTTAVQTNIITYRWLPKEIEMFLIKYHGTDLAASIEKIICKTQDHIHFLGSHRKINGFVSKTKIEITVGKMYSKKLTVLRAIPAHITTTAWHIKSLLKDQNYQAFGYFIDQANQLLEPEHITKIKIKNLKKKSINSLGMLVNTKSQNHSTNPRSINHDFYNMMQKLTILSKKAKL